MAARLRVSTGKRHLDDTQRLSREINQMREAFAKQEQELVQLRVQHPILGDGQPQPPIDTPSDSEDGTESDRSPREGSQAGTAEVPFSKSCRRRKCQQNRTNLKGAQEVIDQLNARVKSAEEQLAKFKAAVATNIVESMEKYTAGLNTKQSKAPLEDDGKPLPSFEEVLTKLKLTMAEKYEVCPICGSITSDLCDHLGKEKTMSVKATLAGAAGLTMEKTVPLHYFCPDPNCEFHDEAHSHRARDKEDASDDEQENHGHSKIEEQCYLTTSLYEHYLECHAAGGGRDGDGDDSKQRAYCELEELRRKALAAKIAAGDVI